MISSRGQTAEENGAYQLMGNHSRVTETIWILNEPRLHQGFPN
jgi:hypothetical protein